MDLFTYLLGKKGQNTQRDLFSYLLGKGAGGSGTYVNYSGTSLNISNTLRARIKNIELKGATSQHTTAGKNKLPLASGTVSLNGNNKYRTLTSENGIIHDVAYTTEGVTGEFANAIRISVSLLQASYSNSASLKNDLFTLPAGTYSLNYIHLSGTQSSTGANNNSSALQIMSVVDNVATRIGFLSTHNNTNVSLSFTLEEETQLYITSSLYIGGSIIGSVDLNKDAYYQVTITPGETADYDFEEYTGGQPSPSPDYPQPIKVVTGDQIIDIAEKNLIDTSTNVTGYYINTNGVITSGAGHNYTALIPVKQASYRFSGTQVRTTFNNKRIHGYDTNGNWVQQITSFEQGQGEYSKVFTVDNESIKYIRLSYYQDDTSVILNQTYPLSLGTLELAKIGTYQDYIYGTPNNWYKHEAISHKEITSSLTYANVSVTENYSRVQISKGSVGMARGVSIANVSLCTHFKEANHSVAQVGNYNSNNNAYNLQFYLPTTVTTIEEAKTYMDNLTDNIIYYVKATPTDTQITDTTLIEQLNNLYNATSQEGTTYITCSSASSDNEIIVFSGDVKVTSVGLGNSLNTSLLSSNIQNEEKPNIDDVNETEDIEQNDEPIENEEPIEEEVS